MMHFVILMAVILSQLTVLNTTVILALRMTVKLLTFPPHPNNLKAKALRNIY